MSKKVTRLFKQFIPENYHLTLHIDPEKMAFQGSVVVTGKKTGRPSQRLTFHQNGLKITDAEITFHGKKDAQKLELTRINHHRSLHEVRLHTNKMVYPGLYTVQLDFSGNITKSMVGLYPAFFEHEGQKQVIFATQFESHHAREVFPCIDEPEAKATFDLELITPAGQEVLANTPIVKQKANKDKLTTTFETTPIMSTYLLAFAFGNLHFKEATSKSGITIRSWASKAQPLDSLDFSLHEAVKVLDFYEDYFGTKFPLKKLDQLALPDFDSGAMENWGLITYREIAMLTDPKNPSVPSQQYVALVIAHEISHQWFGNLVTMRWWDDLWLNESFASLAEHICLDALHPDWHQWEMYTSTDVITCSNRDIYSSVQPVGVGVRHPDEIITLFDPAIVYAKGGRLLKMMREYIGENAFREGLKNYFKVHAFKNTSRDDLWSEMSKSSGRDIGNLMTPWLTQSGMPIVKIEKAVDSTSRNISQSRFVLDIQNDETLWSIPLLPSEKLDVELLSAKTAVVDVSGDATPVFNHNGSGHYVTHYADDSDVETIIQKVEKTEINTEARINILNDLLLLARRGNNSIVDALKLTEKMQNEPRDAVWALIIRAIGLAHGLGEYTESIENGLRKLRKKVSEKNYKKLGWDDATEEDLNTISLRASILSLMIGSEDQAVINEALARYANYKELEDIPADRRGHILGAAVRYSNDTDVIDRLITKHKQTHDADLQMSLSAALCSTRSVEVAKRLCDEAMGPDGFVRNQDLFRWFAYLMRNKYTRDTAWDWLTASWPRISKEAGGAKSLEYYIWYSAGPMHTNEWLDRFNQMFEPKKKIVALERNISIAEAEIQARIAWRDRELSHLEAYVKSLQ